MTHTYECLVMPPIAPSSLPPPIPIYRTRSGLASEPLCLASEVRDGRVPFPRSDADERMHLSGGSPHKDNSAQPQPPGDNAPTRRRTVRRKKSSLGLREDFLKSSEGTSPTTETLEPSPVDPEPAQS